ncbi:MAG: dihydropteroate synthase [Acidobacteriota bacterium]|nr:dihydropteroate synthase [Acidobacteriota bacterium]
MGQRTWITGILNVTPDSFSDGGLYLERNKAVKRGLELAEEGADIIDIGGESTRPCSNSISTEEELKRIIPVLSDLREKTDALISVDTTKSEVARAALDHGADIINDISALRFDPQMPPLAVNRDVPVVLMHMKGTPKTMQANPSYEDLLAEVKSFFKERLETAKMLGIKREKIIIDPGIGFGKRHNDNLLLIKNLRALEEFERPIMIGISRKSFIGKILNLPVLERIEGTIASAVLSIIHGAHILRVHDVAPIKRAVLVAEAIMEENRNPDSSINNMEKNYNYVC